MYQLTNNTNTQIMIPVDTCPSMHTCCSTGHVLEYATVHASVYTSAWYMSAGIESSCEFMRVWYVLNNLGAMYTTKIYITFTKTHVTIPTHAIIRPCICVVLMHIRQYDTLYAAIDHLESIDHLALRVICRSCVCMRVYNKHSIQVGIPKCRCVYNGFKNSINLTNWS